MYQSIHEAAEDLDTLVEKAHALRAMMREARAHGYTARVVGRNVNGAWIPNHLLVTSSDGGCRTFTTATALVAWMGY
jgi:hypothetical protein